MGVGPPDGGDASVQEPAHGQLLAGGLGVHVHQDHARLIVGEQVLGDDEGIVGVRVQRELAHQIDHADRAVGRGIGGVAPSGTLGREVGRAQDPRLLVQIGLELPPGPGMIAQRHHVGARLQDLVGLSGRDAHHIGVLPVDDGKGNAHHFLIRLEVLLQKGDASLTDHVAHSQNIDRHAIILRSVPLQFPIVNSRDTLPAPSAETVSFARPGRPSVRI